VSTSNTEDIRSQFVKGAIFIAYKINIRFQRDISPTTPFFNGSNLHSIESSSYCLSHTFEMDGSSTPEVLTNLSSKYIPFPAISSPLSSPPASELPDIMSQIEEDMDKDMDKEKTDSEKDADDIEDSNARRRTIVQKYARLRYQL
jgi:hypothetical protein